MPKIWRVAALVALGMTVMPSAQAAPSVPLPPTTVWGTLEIDGVPAADGTILQAKIEGVVFGTATVKAQDNMPGAYVMDVRADDPFTSEIEGGTPGQIVRFAGDGLLIDQMVNWGQGAVHHLDLAARHTVTVEALFDCIPRRGSPPITVMCTDRSIGDVTSWTWDFGDGATSTVQNATHTYVQSGPYTISLTVSGPAGSDTMVCNQCIDVKQPVAAMFECEVQQGPAPVTIKCTDQSTGEVTSWLWNFGDDNTSTERYPIHQYATDGFYTVTLTVSGPGGQDTLTREAYISAFAQPQAAFRMSTTTGIGAVTVQFEDQSAGKIDAWTWYVNHVIVSRAMTPTYTFGPGTYTITLMVSSPGGSDTEICENCVSIFHGQFMPVLRR